MSNIGLPEKIVDAMAERAMTDPSRGIGKELVRSYSAKITINGRVKYLGTFDSVENAHLAYMREAELNGITVKNNGVSTSSHSGYIGVIITEYERRELKDWPTPKSWLEPDISREKNGVRIKSYSEPNRAHRNENMAKGRARARNDNQSGLKGAMKTGTGKWMSRISTGSGYKYLGYFHSAEEAHEAYIQAAYGGFYKNAQVLPNHKDHSFVYIVKYDEKYFKIGVAKDPIERLATIATSLPLAPELVLSIYSEDAYLVERKLHKQFQPKRLNGEWFLLAKEDVDFIVTLADAFHCQ